MVKRWRSFILGLGTWDGRAVGQPWGAGELRGTPPQCPGTPRRRGGLVSRTILIPLSNTISAAIQFSGYVRNSP
eukprot:scaffold982_cov89-Skeletonema_dohrnii-CCMP3373.AAC.1